MGEIIDVNFNFNLFEGQITNMLNDYNKLKELYCDGIETELTIIEKASNLTVLIELFIETVNYRMELIKQEYMEDKFHQKQNLKKEKLSLSKKVEWYEKLKRSLLEEVEKIKKGEFDFDVEPDFEE